MSESVDFSEGIYLRLAQKEDVNKPGIVSKVYEVKTLKIPSPVITATMDSEDNMLVNVEPQTKQGFTEIIQYSFDESFTNRIEPAFASGNKYYIPLVSNVYIRMKYQYSNGGNTYDSDFSNIEVVNKVADFYGKISGSVNKILKMNNYSVDFTSTPSSLTLVNTGNNITVSMVIDGFDYTQKKNYIIKTGINAVVPANTYILVESPEFTTAKSSDAGPGTLAFKEIAVTSDYIVGVLEHAVQNNWDGNLRDTKNETMHIRAYMIIRRK